MIRLIEESYLRLRHSPHPHSAVELRLVVEVNGHRYGNLQVVPELEGPEHIRRVKQKMRDELAYRIGHDLLAQVLDV